MSKRPYNNQIIKILGGKWKRRSISYASADIRPTGSRIRETLFNWLKPYIYDCKCLDLFAGSGILGIEALSQGASFCEFRDCNTANLSVIDEHLRHFNHTSYVCNKAKYPHNIPSDTFDLIFIDPPYSQYTIEETLQWIKLHHLAHKNSLIYCEHSLQFDSVDGFQTLKSACYGNVNFAVLKMRT